MADFHYLSARLLFLHGIYPVALHNGATAVEMYLKCLLLLKGEDPKRRHNLQELFKRAKINLVPEVFQFVQELQKSYVQDKYPDSWTDSVIWKESIGDLDDLIQQLRNQLVAQLSLEEKKFVQDFLKIIMKQGFLIPDVSCRYGVMDLKNVFLRANDSFAKFEYM